MLNNVKFLGKITQWLECQFVKLDVVGSNPTFPDSFFSMFSYPLKIDDTNNDHQILLFLLLFL